MCIIIFLLTFQFSFGYFSLNDICHKICAIEVYDIELINNDWYPTWIFEFLNLKKNWYSILEKSFN